MNKMIFETGREIIREDIRYRVAELLHTDKGGYREEYLASVRVGDEPEQSVRLTVYKLAEGVATDACKTESELRRQLQGDQFETYREDFEMAGGEEGKLFVIVSDFKESRSLREVMANDELQGDNAWQLFADIVMGLSEISRKRNGACHFGINPDTICVYADENGKQRALIQGLNFVCDDFRKNSGLDKSLILPEFRAPESVVQKFVAKSMQWSLALLLTYMLQGKHPWGFTPETAAFMAYSQLRRNRPEIEIEGDLGKALSKALSFNASQRFSEIDDFITEVMNQSPVEMPDSYESFNKPAADTSPQEQSSGPSREEGGAEAKEEKESVTGRREEPTVSVKIDNGKGAGFAAVAGMNTLKEELRRDFIDPVANRKLAEQYGIIPPGMLFYGPPGCGKTYLAEHLAQELGIDFSLVNPADLGSIYIHGSQKMIADLFAKAEKKAKKNGKGVLLIFDEMESMVPSRVTDGHDSQSGEVAEFLVRLNNSSKRGVYVIGTTNCLDKVDKAVLRKGRLDKVVYIDLPDFEARKALFEYELCKRPHMADIDLEHLSKITEGYTSSDITYIVTEGARLMFASTLLKKSEEPLRIDQSVIEEVISKTRPSVTKSDLRHYEEMRDTYANGEKKRATAIGFTPAAPQTKNKL